MSVRPAPPGRLHRLGLPSHGLLEAAHLGKRHRHRFDEHGRPRLRLRQAPDHSHRTLAVADLVVGRRREQSRQCVREPGLVRKRLDIPFEPIARLAVPSQTDQADGVPETSLRDRGVEAKDLQVVGERLLDASAAPQRIGQAELRLQPMPDRA